MKAIINDATNIRSHAFYKTMEHEKELNWFLERKDWMSATSYIKQLHNNNWLVSILHNAKEKKEVKEWSEAVKDWANFHQTITPRQPILKKEETSTAKDRQVFHNWVKETAN